MLPYNSICIAVICSSACVHHASYIRERTVQHSRYTFSLYCNWTVVLAADYRDLAFIVGVSMSDPSRLLQTVRPARGARIVSVTATVVKSTLTAALQPAVRSVRPASREATVTTTSTSAPTARVTVTPRATTPSAPSSVSVTPGSLSTTTPSVKVCCGVHVCNRLRSNTVSYNVTVLCGKS